jgi:hypothetical protein
MEAALDSVGSATLLAEQIPGPVGEALLTAAHQSFMDAWNFMAYVVCGIAFIAGLLVVKWMPPHHLPEEHADELATGTAAEKPSLAS